jgi:hypothetical protein
MLRDETVEKARNWPKGGYTYDHYHPFYILFARIAELENEIAELYRDAEILS